MKLGITMLIHNKDDIEFVTAFPCFLGHSEDVNIKPMLLDGCIKYMILEEYIKPMILDGCIISMILEVYIYQT